MFAALFALAGAPRAQTAPHDLPGEDERLIVYGGFGSLMNVPGFRDFARNFDLHNFARDAADGFPIGKTTIAISSDDVLAELSRRDGKTASFKDIQTAIETGLLYVTTFVSSFQYRVLGDTVKAGGASARTELYIATATLVVSRAEDGAVIFAVPVSGIRSVPVAASAFSAQPDGSIFADIYRSAIPAALKRVSKIIGKSGEAFENPHMVVAVHGGHPTLRKVFGIKDRNLEMKRVFCKGSAASSESGELWRRLSSFLAQDVTARLAAKGVVVLPPADWYSLNGKTTTEVDKVIGKIGFSTVGGMTELDNSIRLQVSPASADRKLIVQIGALFQKDIKSKGVDMTFKRIYRAPVQVAWFENPSARECGKIVDQGILFQNGKPEFSVQTRMMEDYGKAPSLKEQAEFAWPAIISAFKGLGPR